MLIDQAVIEGALATAMSSGGEFAEVFAEDRRRTGARLDDGRIEDLSSGRERGAGIRVVSGETTGFAYTSDLSEAGLRAAAEAAAAAARHGGGGVNTVPLRRVDAPARTNVSILPETVAKADKVAILQRADEAARRSGGPIRQVSAGYGDARRRILVANTEGVLAEDDQVRTMFTISCVASGDTGLQTGRDSAGFTMGFELFDELSVEEMAEKAAQRAITKLSARPAPAGLVPVVIKHGSGGVLFHEACGHGLEADLVAKDSSVFRNRVGQKVASELVTLVDDGTMGPEWGAIAIDDEGHPAQSNVLIEDGVLTDYMWDWLRARKEGRAGSGNGRRESYQHLPMVRMTNTFLKNGESDPDEIVRQTPYGVYVAQLGGGSVNTATGDFVFGMTEAYLIEDGQITEPLRDANLIGNGPEVLRNIDVVGNDFAMGPPGTCGKDGQGVPVGDGQPTLRVTELTVGGTARSMTSPEELLELATRVAGWARDGEQIEAFVSKGSDTSIVIYEGNIEKFESATSAGIGIRVVANHRQGFAYAGSLDEDVIAETLADARDNAQFATEDEFFGLAGPDGVAPTPLDVWRDELAAYPTEKKIELALELERAVRGGDPRVRQVTDSSWGDTSVAAAVATSTGIAASSRRTFCSLSAEAIAGATEETQTGYGYTVGRAPSDLDLDKAAADAVMRSTRLLGAVKPRSAHLTAVFEPMITSTLLGIIAGTLSGEAVLKGRSLFAERIGEQVAVNGFTLIDDPTDPEAYSAAMYDGEGLATRRNVLIADGVLQMFLYDTYAARRAGTVGTGSAVRGGYRGGPGTGARAISLQPGTQTPEEIYKAVGDGLIVQSVTGIHSGVNPVSGDFSVGAEGLLIEGGAPAGPVREFTIASTIQRMLTGVVAIGSDVERLPGFGLTLAISDISMSGQ